MGSLSLHSRSLYCFPSACVDVHTHSVTDLQNATPHDCSSESNLLHSFMQNIKKNPRLTTQLQRPSQHLAPTDNFHVILHHVLVRQSE